MWRTYRTSLVWLVLIGAAACRQDMHDQLKVEPLEQSNFYGDGLGSRKPVEGTVARGQLDTDRHLHLGVREPTEVERTALGPDRPLEPAADFPMPVTRALIDRGHERYDVFCAPCHARDGDGDGMVVRRGFRKPPALYEQRLIDAKVGDLYDVVRQGRGAMPGYAAQIPVRDRWAIVAYLRALQLARRANYDQLPQEDRAAISRGGPP